MITLILGVGMISQHLKKKLKAQREDLKQQRDILDSLPGLVYRMDDYIHLKKTG